MADDVDYRRVMAAGIRDAVNEIKPVTDDDWLAVFDRVGKTLGQAREEHQTTEYVEPHGPFKVLVDFVSWLDEALLHAYLRMVMRPKRK